MKLKNILKFIKLNESAVRILTVFILIIIVGQLFIQLSETDYTEQTFNSIGDEVKTNNTHIVQTGENLWGIAVKYFDNGFRWTDIATENNLKDVDGIEVGQKLIIPTTTDTIDFTNNVTPAPSATDINNPKNTSSISTEAKTYIVTKSDSLWSIAESQYGSGFNWIDIAKANNLKSPGIIFEGQELFIPNVNPVVPTKGKITDLKTVINGESYVVEKGDSLWEIAIRAYGDGYKWTILANSNDLKYPNLIYPGQPIKIPRN